jgi:mono/diheme cytochrome c family protein
MLRGAEVALNVSGAQMPGNRGRRGGGAAITAPGATAQTPAVAPPCPTCPGGRAGPGGAYAFPQVPQTNAGRGRGGGPALRVNQEPAALSALAAGSGEFAPRVTALLARVEWPGKPGASAPIVPLTPAEQKLFLAGQEVYKNICIACHQPDGRGMDRIAPTLIGSTLALAPAEVTARILLNGKEGPVGLMPPVGSTLSDDQIAGVLTYVRREWGQDGTPVSPETVKAVRALTVGRARPWTNDELLKMIPGGRGGQ